jgi:hypothetical protein
MTVDTHEKKLWLASHRGFPPDVQVRHLEANRDRDRTESAHALFWREASHEVRTRVNQILEEAEDDIEPAFLGFLGWYHAAADLVPTDWTIFDLGCAYAIQSWFFRNHRKYVGVDVSPIERRFVLPNSAHYLSDIEAWLPGVVIPEPSFAILSYVPCSAATAAAVRSRFPDLLCYYPKSTKPIFPPTMTRG